MRAKRNPPPPLSPPCVCWCVRPYVRDRQTYGAARTSNILSLQLPRKREGKFSAERDKSSRNELSGWTGRGRQRMTSMMRTYGGAQPGPAPQALGQCGSASDPLVTLSASYSASSACRIRKAPPRQLSASGAASVFQRDPPPTPVHLHECVCPLIATRVRRGLLLKIPTAYDIEKVGSLRSAISLLVTS